MRTVNIDMKNIRDLVGDVNESDLRYVDCYTSDNFGIFIPRVGYCQRSIKPMHTHPAYSFVVFPSEQSIMPVDIEMKHHYYLAAAFGPDVPHEEEVKDTFTRYVAITIAKELYESVYAIYCCNPPGKYLWYQFQVENDIMFYLKKFISECENGFPGANDLRVVFSIIMTHQLIRNILNISNQVDITTDKFEIQRTVAFMHQHFGEKLSIAGLAKKANMSESHFIRVFKTETGLPPMEYLIKIRHCNAKMLLRGGIDSITEVSLQCGFNSISHFSTSFSKHIGMTPSEYQKSYSNWM